MAIEVEQDRREVRGGQLVTLALPTEDRVAGQVRLVRHRAVRVPVPVLPLAAAVVLDAQNDAAVAVGRPAGAPRLLREVAVRRLPVGDAVGTDHAGVADVDHVRVRKVEPYSKTAQKHRRRGEHPDGPHRP